MRKVKEVIMDRQGRITLDPEILEHLRVTLPKDDGETVKLRCVVKGEAIILTAIAKASEPDWIKVEREAFFRTPLGQYVLQNANPDVTLDEVLAITSKVKGTLAAEAIAEREERF